MSHKRGKHPTSETLSKMRSAALVLTKGGTWKDVAARLKYASGQSARVSLIQRWPKDWARVFRETFDEYVPTVEAVAVDAQIDLIKKGDRKNASPQDKQLKQSAAHSLLAWSSRIRARESRLALKNEKGEPLEIRVVGNIPRPPENPEKETG